jgi:hypothetical protein
MNSSTWQRWSDPQRLEEDLLAAESKAVARSKSNPPLRKDDTFLTNIEKRDDARYQRSLREGVARISGSDTAVRAATPGTKAGAPDVKMSENSWTDVESEVENEDLTYEAGRHRYVPPSKKEMAYHTGREAFIDVAEGTSIATRRLVKSNYFGASSKAVRTVGKGIRDVGTLVGMGVKEGALLAAMKWNGTEIDAGSQPGNPDGVSAKSVGRAYAGDVHEKPFTLHVKSHQERMSSEEREWIEGDPILDFKLHPAEDMRKGGQAGKQARLGSESRDKLYHLLEANLKDLRANKAANPVSEWKLPPKKGKPNPRAAIRHAEEEKRRQDAEDFELKQRIRALMTGDPQQRGESPTPFVAQETFATAPSFQGKTHTSPSGNARPRTPTVGMDKAKRGYREPKNKHVYDPDGFRVPQKPTRYNTYTDADDEFAQGTKEYGDGESILRTHPFPATDDDEKKDEKR